MRKKNFELVHDRNNHSEFNRIYMKLTQTIHISKMNRKIKQYIKHCFICELHQIKKHASYDELISIESKMISFKIIVMNFIVTFPRINHDFLLTIICKAFKKMTFIFEMITWIAEK